MKKLSSKQKLIILISIITIIVIIGIILSINAIRVNIANGEYNSSNSSSSNGNLLPEYIKKGITLGGITGTLESLNTFDATAKPEDIIWGETAYVKGEKITGTKILTVAQGKVSQKVFEDNTSLIDDYQNKVVIPSGFKIAEDSATAVEDGVVIEDGDGNQFVWIPAKTGAGATINLSTRGTATIVYKRTDFGKPTGSYSEYSETMPNDELISVNANGGYYIGRYEAGDEESVNSAGQRIMRNSSSPQNHKIVIKKGQVPYNWISYTNLKSLAEGMDTVQGYNTAKTKLVSSYAWDTAINFIQIKNSDYGTNSPEGNYYNAPSFTYIDLNGNMQQGPQTVSIPTGQTTATSNIYDMGGNLWEYTTEVHSGGLGSCTTRGGGYGDIVCSAGYRGNIDGGAREDTFRVTLYCTAD